MDPQPGGYAVSFITPERQSVVLPGDGPTGIALTGGGSTLVVTKGPNPVAVPARRVPQVVVTMAIPGPAGPAGPEGPAGADSPGLRILDQLDSIGDLPPAAALGDAYLVGLGDAQTAWLFTATGWKDIGSIKGPKGDPGQIRFTGEGDPPAFIPGARPGDVYLDLISGNTWTVV